MGYLPTGSIRTRLLILATATVFSVSCSSTAGITASTGKLVGSVTHPSGEAVVGARIIVSAIDGTIQPQSSVVVLTDADGSFEVTLYAANFREREAEGMITIQPPSGSTLPDTVVAVLLRTGPSDPTTETSVVYE